MSFIRPSQFCTSAKLKKTTKKLKFNLELNKILLNQLTVNKTKFIHNQSDNNDENYAAVITLLMAAEPSENFSPNKEFQRFRN